MINEFEDGQFPVGMLCRLLIFECLGQFFDDHLPLANIVKGGTLFREKNQFGWENELTKRRLGLQSLFFGNLNIEGEMCLWPHSFYKNITYNKINN